MVARPPRRPHRTSPKICSASAPGDSLGSGRVWATVCGAWAQAPAVAFRRWPTSVRLCGTRGCARASISVKSRRARRSAPSTCGRSRTRNGICSRARSTSRASCAPTAISSGLDSRLLIDDYKRRFERPSDHEMRPIAALGRERERAAKGPLIPPWAIIGLVLAAVVGALAILGSGTGKKPTNSDRAAPDHESQTPPGQDRTTPRPRRPRRRRSSCNSSPPEASTSAWSTAPASG